MASALRQRFDEFSRGRMMRSGLLKHLVLFLLLFTQAALALEACASVDAKAADAFVVMPPDCGMADMPASTNLCLAQCLTQDQSDAHANVVILPPALLLDQLHRLPDPIAARTTCYAQRQHPATGPPLSLLCSLQL